MVSAMNRYWWITLYTVLPLSAKLEQQNTTKMKKISAAGENGQARNTFLGGRIAASRFYPPNQWPDCLSHETQRCWTYDLWLWIRLATRHWEVLVHNIEVESSAIDKFTLITTRYILFLPQYRNSPKSMIYDNGLHQTTMNFLFTNYRDHHP
jgi:hypothetical protein